MSKNQYVEYIAKMINEITNEEYLKIIYRIVHNFFISEDR